MNDLRLSVIDNSQEKVFEYLPINLDIFEASGYILNHISKEIYIYIYIYINYICKYDMLMIDILI